MYWLRRKIHPTWHFTAFCLGIVVGIAMAPLVGGVLAAGWAGIGLILTAFSVWRRHAVLIILAVLGGMLIGLARGSAEYGDRSLVSSLYGQGLTLSGRIADDVDSSKRGQSILRLASASVNGRQLAGEFWVSVPARKDLRRSDTVAVRGELSEGFGSFVGAMYDANIVNVQREIPGDAAVAVRDNFAAHVRQSIDDPAASLGIGYLLGQKQALPMSLSEALVVTGLTHIVVASGYNLTVLVRIARRLLARFSKYAAAAMGVALTVGFILITGLSPSMTRAGLVTFLGLWAWYVGRRFHPVTLLAIAAAVTLLARPSYAWGDLGWSLSFAAFAGVMIVAPIAQAFFWGSDRPHSFGRLLIEAAAAQVATMPIILLAFGKLSILALIMNSIVVPFVPLAMLLTFVAGLAGYMSNFLSTFLGWPAETLLGTMIWTIEQGAAIPWAQINITFPWWGAAVWYGLLIAAIIVMKRVTGYSLRAASVVE